MHDFQQRIHRRLRSASSRQRNPQRVGQFRDHSHFTPLARLQIRISRMYPIVRERVRQNADSSNYIDATLFESWTMKASGTTHRSKSKKEAWEAPIPRRRLFKHYRVSDEANAGSTAPECFRFKREPC